LAVAIVLVFSLSIFEKTNAQSSDPNWSYPAYDSNNTNFNPQNVINKDTIGQLQLSWIYQVPVNPYHIVGAPPALGIETTPLVVSGIVYVATPYNRLIALNALTGGVVWYYQVNMSEFPSKPWWSSAYIISSILYNDGTIYMMASDTSLHAVDAITGQVKFVIPDIAKAIP
jgi:glucose dehydrogenase